MEIQPQKILLEELKVLFADVIYSKAGMKQNGVYDSKTTRYKLFTQRKFEGSKLPPTKGALQKHLERAHYQILQWNFSYLTEIPDNDPLHHGWVLKNGNYRPERRADCTKKYFGACIVQL